MAPTETQIATTTEVDEPTSTIETSQTGAFPAPEATTKRRRWGRAAWAALGLFLVAVALLIWLLWPDPPPQPPESVQADAIGSASISLEWDTPSGPAAESYVVLNGEDEVGSTAAPATSITLTGLTPNTRHELTVVSVDGDRRSEPSLPVVATTDPGTPTGIELGESTATSVELDWEAPPGPGVESYEILNGADEVGSVAAPANSIEVTGLTPNTRHELAVVAVDGDRRSEPSYTIGITTLPGAPASLGFEDLAATSVVLRWETPPGPDVDAYVITDPVEELSTVPHPETSLAITDLIPGASYDFAVAAQAGARRSAPAFVTLTATAPSPGGLTSDQEQTTTDSIAISWAPPGALVPAAEYVVARDGRPVATVPGDTFTYTDTGLAPATTYEYSVVASWGYEPSAPTATIEVSTLEPPIADARLLGPWSVDITSVDDPGDNLDDGAMWTSTWRFEPSCDAGACDVTLAGDHSPPGYTFKGFSIVLVRDGATYSGSGKAEITYCNEQPVENTVTARLTVDDADVRDGTWVATSWSGTLEISSPYVEVGNFYCPSQRITEDISATK